MEKRRGRLPSASSTSPIEVEESQPVAPPPVPPGLRFAPTDQELIISFLHKKIHNLPVRDDRNIVNQVNLHKYHPADLIEKYKLSGEEAWYFFTPRNRKYFKGYRPNRTAGTGFWKASTIRTDIHVDHQIIGYKVGLSYYEGKQSEGKKTKWLMTEYCIHESLQPPNHAMQLDAWVLCKVYQKNADTNSNVDEPYPEGVIEMSPPSPADEAIQEEDDLHHKIPIKHRKYTTSDQTRADRVVSRFTPTSTVPSHILYSPLPGLGTHGATELSSPFPIDEATKMMIEKDVLLRNIFTGRRASRLGANHLNQTDSSQPPKRVFGQATSTAACTLNASQYRADLAYSTLSDTPPIPRLQNPSPSQIFTDHSHLPDNETRNQEHISHNNISAALPSSVPQSSNLQLTCWKPLPQNSGSDNQISSMHNFPHPPKYSNPHTMGYNHLTLEIQQLRVATSRFHGPNTSGNTVCTSDNRPTNLHSQVVESNATQAQKDIGPSTDEDLDSYLDAAVQAFKAAQQRSEDDFHKSV